MTRLLLRGMAERKLRSALTTLAVLLGVAMIAGTYVTTDQIRSAFTDIEKTAGQGVDAVVTPRTAFTFTQNAMSSGQTLPQSLVARVAAVDGVDAVAPSLTESGALVKDGKAIIPSFAPTLVLTVAPAPFDPTRTVTGRRPARPGEVAVNRKLFADEHLHLGQRLGLTTRQGIRPVTLVGAFDFGSVSSIGGATIVLTRLADAQRWYDRAGRISQISASAAPGVSPQVLARRIRAVLPASSVTVRTGDAQEARNAADMNAGGSFLTSALLAFAGAAVLVGAFIIYNTFSITVMQRTHEFGLLRALGARRRQILGAVLAEAVVLGALAAALGLLAGLGFARLLGALFDAAGWGIPRSGMTLAPRTIAVCFAVGIGVTAASSLGPAVRATRVPPVAALLAGAQGAERRRRGRLARALRLAPGLAGVALVLHGLLGSGTVTGTMLAVAAGAVLVFAGVGLNADVVVPPVAAAVGWPVERVFGMSGRLARENAMRNPSRTAITSAALMIGLGLVVFVAVLASGIKASVADQFDRYVSADLIVTGKNFTPLPAASARRVEAVPGVAATASMLFDAVKVNGRPRKDQVDLVSALAPDRLAAVYRFRWLHGSDATLRSLGSDRALVEEQFVLTHHLRMGGRFRVTSPSGGTMVLRVAGEYRDPTLLQGFVVTQATFARFSTVRDPISLFLRTAAGTRRAAVQAAVARALRPFPTARVQTQEAYRRTIQATVDQLVYLLYALLAVSVVISLFGIANSLFLSIHERTAEFGTLRAIGATRRQVRQMVREESVITAGLGGVLGIGVGVFFGWALTRALDAYALTFSLPVGQIAAFLVLAVLVGVVAAIVPARRGAAIRILEAVHHE